MRIELCANQQLIYFCPVGYLVFIIVIAQQEINLRFEMSLIVVFNNCEYE